MLFTKKLIALVFCIFSVAFVSAQGKYVLHTLKQGESLSMLAKEYNTSVGDIMRMNGMHADTKLVYGSQIKIPSTKDQNTVAKKSSNEVVVNTRPVATTSNEITHVVTKGETLYSISKKYNITVDQIKNWNHLPDNEAKIGTLLIISDNGNNKVASVSSQKQRVETVAASTQQINQPAVDNNQDVKTEPATNAQNNQPATTLPVAQPQNNNASTTDISQINTDYSGAGFFQSDYKNKKAKQTQNISGISKTFKTASGWTDGKFYILANDIQPGTIVKITADNGNSVYAKVLWNMGDLKENAGIDFRVSNATAAALHEDASSFNISLSF